VAHVSKRLVALEADVRYREPAEDEAARIGVVPGSVPVVLSAPHGAVHTRQGRAKEEEEYTAALAMLVAALTGAHALYARRRSSTDPNWYAEVPYKERLRQIVEEEKVRFVFDLHGMAPHRSIGIALGTMKGRSCPEQRDEIVRLLEASGFRQDAAFPNRLDVDRTFTARGLGEQETVTRFASQCLGVPAAQIELHPSLRVVERREDASLPKPYRGDVGGIACIVQALVLLVQSVAGEGSHFSTAECLGSALEWSRT